MLDGHICDQMNVMRAQSKGNGKSSERARGDIMIWPAIILSTTLYTLAQRTVSCSGSDYLSGYFCIWQRFILITSISRSVRGFTRNTIKSEKEIKLRICNCAIWWKTFTTRQWSNGEDSLAKRSSLRCLPFTGRIRADKFAAFQYNNNLMKH